MNQIKSQFRNHKSQIFVLIFALTILTGCFGKVPDINDRIPEDINQEQEYTGIIEPLEIDVYQQGTHQIRTDNNEVIIIQSRDFDLNRYLEKRVIIKGQQAEVVGNTEPVLNVTGIEFEDGSGPDEFLDYDNRLFGLGFTYPSAWELTETSGGLSLAKDDYEWVSVGVYSDKTDIDAFVSSQESGEGTPVTIGAQKSFRYLDGSSIRVYVPNPPKKKIYKIVFNEEKRDADGEKEIFYDLLKSVRLIYSNVVTGDKCGGKEDIKCAEEYRCELKSAEIDAEGICVPLKSEGAEPDCPFIPVPADCGDYRVAEYSKEAGCPTRYQCVDGGADVKEEQPEELNVEGLIATIEKYSDQILDTEGAKIIQYELTENEGLISVIYEHENKKYKTLYSFAPSADEFNFIEKAHFEEGEDRDWKLISGEDVQSGYNKTVINAGEGVEILPREVSDDMRLYENQHKDFSLEYPKDWYYKSFGAINNTRWLVGFSDKPLDFLSDAVITVSIVDEKPGSSVYGYSTVRNRDDGTFYVIEGPEDMKETIDKMAESIE